MTERRLIKIGDKHQISCDCGRWLSVDSYTECDRCGAHYELSIEQTVPPIEDKEKYNK